MKYTMKSLRTLFTILFTAIFAGSPGSAFADVAQIEASNSPVYYSFDKGTKEVINVYVHVFNRRYAWFKVVHEVNENKYKNLWRIFDSYMCELKDGAMVSLYRILTAGENEFVWRSARDGVVDFTGGFHGNERIDLHPESGISFVADDKPLDLRASIPLTACTTFHYVQHSTMHETGIGGLVGSADYQPIPGGGAIECFHEKKTVFSNGGFDCYNTLIWDDNCTPVKVCYYGIFCVDGGIAKEGSNESGTKVVFNDDGQMELHSTGSEITMTNDDLGITVVCNARLEQPAGIYKTSSMIWDKGYHKYYCAINNGGATRTRHGEEWKTVSSIHFTLK